MDMYSLPVDENYLPIPELMVAMQLMRVSPETIINMMNRECKSSPAFAIEYHARLLEIEEDLRFECQLREWEDIQFAKHEDVSADRMLDTL